MKTIYLIRHGETDNNRLKILQGGNVDISLNEKGKEQAEAFYLKYKNIPFKKIYTSTLIRSIESVQNFISKGIPHETIADLNEISYGIYDGKVSSEGENSLYCKLTNAWKAGDLEAKLEGGESPLEVQQRMKHALEYILNKEDESPILICTHGRAMRILLATILHYDLSHMHLFPHTNLGLYILQLTGKLFFIEKLNDIRHLSKIGASEKTSSINS